MKKKKVYKIQPRIPGIVRIQKSSALLPLVERAVRNEALRYGVRPSWVIAVRLADSYKMDIPRYK